MRILGIDLAVVAKHRAILADERGGFISKLVKFRTCQADLERVYAWARRGMRPDEPLAVVLEATGIVWYAVVVFFQQRGATVYLVNPRMAADLARFYQRYAKSDRLSAQTLARLPVVNPDGLYPWVRPGPAYLALQRGCKELERLTTQASAIQNRLRSTDHLGWPDLHRRVFADPFSPAARWFRDHFYDPRLVVAAGVSGLRRAWRAAEVYDGDEGWIEPLLTLAQEVLSLYGEPGSYLDYRPLAEEVRREQRRLAELEAEAHFVRLQVTCPRYRQLHPAATWRRSKGSVRMGRPSTSPLSAMRAALPPCVPFAAGAGWCPTAIRVESEKAKACASPRPVPTRSRSTPSWKRRALVSGTPRSRPSTTIRW